MMEHVFLTVVHKGDTSLDTTAHDISSAEKKTTNFGNPFNCKMLNQRFIGSHKLLAAFSQTILRKEVPKKDSPSFITPHRQTG